MNSNIDKKISLIEMSEFWGKNSTELFDSINNDSSGYINETEFYLYFNNILV
jgi:hypothetical protein